MNKDFNLTLLYLRYKDTPYYSISIIVFVFLISIFLFFQLVIPQVASWFSITDEVQATSKRIATINQNTAFINSMDKQTLEDQVTIATSALPFEKDFGGIVGALNDASTIAGVSLNDYSFQVGNIASNSGQLNSITKGLSSVRITVTLGGNVDNIANFLTEINKRIPLSEVIAVDGDSFTTTITLEFYQKQFPKIAFQDDVPFSPISEKDTDLLQEFSSWKPVTGSDEPQDTSSSQAAPLF